MRLRWCVLMLLLSAAPAPAQGTVPVLIEPLPPALTSDAATGWGQGPIHAGDSVSGGRESLSSNRNFSNFIGFMSNPLQNIDPRALTQVVPIFLDGWVSSTPTLPSLNSQVYGPAISLALSDRLGVGINQGGYEVLEVNRGDRRFPLLSDGRHPLLAQRLRDRGQQFGGTRDGFLNVGGFAQYTFIEDVENQFLATAGVRVIVPMGSYEVFQGKGPAQLAPYLTVGKELGNFHVLVTGGYQFPLQNGDRGLEIFYLNGHLDYQLFGWVYPLVEANWNQHTATVPIGFQTRFGAVDLGNFSSSGNSVTVAVGVNLVLIRDRLEFGGAYIRSVATQRDVDVNAMIVKMVLRF
jgi:hypothetical protein